MLAVLLCACSASNGGTGDTAQSEGNADIPEREVVLFGGDSDYRIVYSDEANNSVKDQLTQMIAKVKEITGKAPEYSTDNPKSKEEIPCEILLGVTKRSESQRAVSSMSALGYDIRFVGEKLVIIASSDELLASAVSSLFGAWSEADGKISISNKTVIAHDATSEMLELYSNGSFEYKIIIPLKSSDSVYSDAVYLSQSLSAITDTVVDVCYDERTPEGAYEICLGQTNREVSQRAYENLESVFEYKTVVSDNKIAVGALQDMVISKAVRMLYSSLYTNIRYAYTGRPAIPAAYSLSGAISEVAAELPTLKAGKLYGMYQSDDDKFVIYTTEVTQSDYSGYIDALKSDGAAVQKEYSFGDNKYTLLSNEKYSAYVSYLPMENAIRTYVGPTDTKYQLQSEATEASAATPALWQLEVDTKGSGSNGGMSYVIRLTDGSFIIFDGGYNTRTESDNLYKILRDNTPEGQTPTVSAWFITHLHIDHYGALLNFASNYAASVDVKAFYYNFPGMSVSSSSNSVDTGVTKEIFTAMKRWKNAQRYDTLHSGMTLGFAGATAEVICTHEDVYPLTFTDGNDTCTVIRLTVGGQKIMFTADARDSQSVIMINTIPASVLKADIVQFAHHGYEGCSASFYRVVGASTVLWPMNIIGVENGEKKPIFKNWYNNGMEANKYIRTSATVKKIIISGAGTQKLELPYTPTGERIVDYEAIYNERLSNY